MPRFYLSLSLSVIFCLGVNTAAQQSAATSDTSVPRLIRYAGVARTAGAAARQGVVGITFYLYKDQTGGAPLWQEVQNVTIDASGHYSVLLGANSKDGLPAELFASNEARWLGVQVEQEPEQARVLLVSVPYALKAADAETVGGHPISDFVLSATSGTTDASGGTVTSNGGLVFVPKAGSTSAAAVGTLTQTQNFLAKFDSGGTLSNSLLFDNGTNVGVGTSVPGAKLDINGGFSVAAFRGNSTDAVMTFQNTAAGGGSWDMVATGTGSSAGAGKFSIAKTGVAHYFTIDTNGNVGISNTSPSAKLDISGGFSVAAFRGNATDAVMTFQNTAAGGGSWDMVATANGSGAGGGKFSIAKTGVAHYFTIDTNGNVGIGNTAPGSRLSVAGPIESTSGGFKFPDATTQTTGLPPSCTSGQVPSWNGAAWACAASLSNGGTINGDLTLNGKIILNGGGKTMILGGFTGSTGQSPTGISPNVTSSGFGLNIPDPITGSPVITVDTSGAFNTAILKAVQTGATDGCPSFPGCVYLNSPAAVRGDATSTTAGKYAFGVVGHSTNAIGVYGQSDTSNAVYGTTGANSHLFAGVLGWATNTTASANPCGGVSQPDCIDPWAVYGGNDSDTGGAGGFIANKSTGSTIGVYGESKSDNGTAGSFYATNTTPGAFTTAVFGKTYSSGGVGGYFVANSSTGSPYGLWSRTYSSDSSSAAGVFDVPSGSFNNFMLRGRQCDFTGGTGCTSYFRVYGDGSTYIGSILPTQSSALLFSSGLTEIGTFASNADLWVYGSVHSNAYLSISSQRFKKNIHTLHGALDKVERLRGVSYDLRSDGSHQIGVIAEEVGEVVPEVVSYETNGKDARGVDYGKLTALLIEAVKEQQATIKALQAEVSGLKVRMAAAESQAAPVVGAE